MTPPLLDVQDLHTFLSSPRGTARAVDGVSFSILPGQIRGIVGESGCGKSMTALSIMQLLPEPAGYVDSGKILFEGRDLLDLTWNEMREVRGNDVAMIFQEPMTSLNPTFTIGNQVREAATVHGKSTNEAHSLAADLLNRVGIENPTGTLRQYPHELSGGMRQRVMISIALANRPKLLIADEPTTALDVTVQAQILRLMRDMQRDYGMAILLITHDLGVVAEMADVVSVMYAGQVVEESPVGELFREPKHPYTRDLLASLPSREARGTALRVIRGTVPPSTAWPTGCRYANRCDFCDKVPWEIAPPNNELAPGVKVRCHLFDAGRSEGGAR